MKQMKDKDKVNKANPIYCSFEHSNLWTFDQTSNAWEVERNICNIIDFEVEKCSEKNVLWICEGRKRCRHKVVYCNKCFFNNKNIVQAKQIMK